MDNSSESIGLRRDNTRDSEKNGRRQFQACQHRLEYTGILVSSFLSGPKR
jgi:hypothetical protein